MGFSLRATLLNIAERVSLATRLADVVRRIAAEFKFRRLRSVVVVVPYETRYNYEVAVPDDAVTLATKVLAQLAVLPESTENGGASADGLSVTAQATAGAVVFFFSGPSFFGGPWTVQYQLGA
jgi:hypothetical protein